MIEPTHTTGGAIVAAAVVLMGRDEARLAEFSSRVLDTGDGFGSLQTMLDSRQESATRVSLPEPGSLFIGTTHCRTGRSALFSTFPDRVALIPILFSNPVCRTPHLHPNIKP